MATAGIKTIFYEVKDLGKYMKGSKKKYTWIFESNGKEQVVDLEYSYLSGKRKVVHNGKVLFDGTQILSAAFQYPFTIEGYVSLNIIQQGDAFELRINNQAFSHMYHQNRTKSEFVFEDDQEGNKEKNEKAKNLTFDEFKTEHKTFEGFGNNPFGYKGPSPQKESGFETFDEAKQKKGFNTEFTNFDSFAPSKVEKEDFSNIKDFDFGKFKAPIKEPQETVAPPKEEIFENVEAFNNLGSFSKTKQKSQSGINSSSTKTSQVQKKQSTNTADLLDLLDDKPAENKQPVAETQATTNSVNVDLFAQFGQTSQNASWDNPFTQGGATTEGATSSTGVAAKDPFSGGFSGFNNSSSQGVNDLAEIFSAPVNVSTPGPQISYTGTIQSQIAKAGGTSVNNNSGASNGSGVQKPGAQTKGDLWSLVDLDLKQEEKIAREQQRINNLSAVSAKPNQTFMPGMMPGPQNYPQQMMYPGMQVGYGMNNSGFGVPQNTGFYPGQMPFNGPQMQPNQMPFGNNMNFANNNPAQTPFDMFK